LSRANFLVFIAVFFSTFVFSLDKAVSGISPEYKDAAQKREAEIARQMFCSEKAGKARSCRELATEDNVGRSKCRRNIIKVLAATLIGTSQPWAALLLFDANQREHL
jgi:hypothetical protein